MYHHRLQGLLDCVDEHKHQHQTWTEADAQKVCGRAWEELRASSIKGELKYPYVNAKIFYLDLARKNSEISYH